MAGDRYIQSKQNEWNSGLTGGFPALCWNWQRAVESPLENHLKQRRDEARTWLGQMVTIIIEGNAFALHDEAATVIGPHGSRRIDNLGTLRLQLRNQAVERRILWFFAVFRGWMGR